jgi:signal transduction histidine kinase
MASVWQRAWISWAAVGLVTLFCGVLGFLQHQWLGDVSRAERTRLHDRLRSDLMNVGRAFNHEVEEACRLAAESGKPGPALVTAAVVREPFSHSRSTISYHLKDDFWLRAELNLEWVREKSLPALIATPGLADFDIQVVTQDAEPSLIFTTGPTRIFERPDASSPILDIPGGGGRGRGPRGPGAGPGPPRDGPGGPRDGPGGPPEPPGLWRIQALRRNGSLDLLVERTQSRNLAVSGALLALILGTAVVLVRLTRQAQSLAEAHIGFVAGVSHELRTPLTVIRTAAFNLAGGKLHSRPEQIERYGRLIAGESEKLEGLIDQVLRFASGRSGQVIEAPRKVDLRPILEEIAAAAGAGVALRLEAELPAALADERAIRHAVRNLLDNAIRYGQKGVTLAARCGLLEGKPCVEIEVSDNGPGIPAGEVNRIFDPFFRGNRARQDQIRGTGLGLNIVKTIAEAHKGSIAVSSAPGTGAHFFLRIPCAENRTV